MAIQDVENPIRPLKSEAHLTQSERIKSALAKLKPSNRHQRRRIISENFEALSDQLLSGASPAEIVAILEAEGVKMTVKTLLHLLAKERAHRSHQADEA